MKNNFNWAFFGTDEFSVTVLDELKNNGLVPSLIVTTEDKPKGRKLVITPPEAKLWAEKEKIKYLQLKTLRNEESLKTIATSSEKDYDFFIVASYGKIIPQNILDIPKYKTLNVHPSLLPKLRGPSPIQSAILTESETGVSIMRLDAEMDHGPILAQEKINTEWPPYSDELEKICAKTGGKMLAKIIPEWVNGKIIEKEQNHDKATFCKKIEKKDAELDLNEKTELNLRKIRAFNVWPGAYFFDSNKDKQIRIIVKKAHIENDELVLDRIIPEGKKEMNYKDYLRGKN
ncbi:MAG: methionyl-tRNA formyltransferase [Parcubacteria bacterium C7867-006]|nr:MAG: methionyl-tRNA formyltransferase [Parcubacteria bacterium C7867-006]